MRRGLVLLPLLLITASTANAAGSDWTAPQMFGPPYETTSFSDRWRYGNPQVLAFADGTAEAIWSDTNPPAQGIRGRHLDADAKPTADAYDVGYPADAVVVPRSKVAPVTGNLGVIVMDASIGDSERRIYGRLLDSRGPVGAIFEISAAIGRVATNDFDVASNGDGTATVVWAGYDGTGLSVKERQIDSSGVTGAVVTVSEPLARDENTNAVHAVTVRGHGDGTASIAWSEEPTAYTTHLKVRRVRATGALGPISEIVTGSSSHLLPARLAAHSDGSVTAAWGTTGGAAGLYVSRISATGAVTSPEHLCAQGDLRSIVGQQCLGIDSWGAGAWFLYDIAANSNARSTVVARRPSGDVRSWSVDGGGQASPSSTLEIPPTLPTSAPQVVGAGQGDVLATWLGNAPSTTLRALHAVRIGAGNAVVGDETLFALAPDAAPPEVLAGPALTAPDARELPIWAAWTDWTSDPAVDPTTTRQVYAARHPVSFTPPAVSCPARKLIGIRGTDEPAGLGKPIGALVKALAALGVLDETATQAIRYPAQAYSQEAGGQLEYAESVAAGVDALIFTMTHDPCAAHTKYILAGYSQGAEVIASAIETGKLRPVRDQVAATLLFGDPRFDGTMEGLAFKGTFRPHEAGGLLGGRANKQLLIGYGASSFCRHADPFCEGDWSDVVTGRFAAHQQYHDAEAIWAAQLVANQVLGQPTTSSKPTVRAKHVGDQLVVTCKLPDAGICQLVVRLGLRWRGERTMLPETSPYDGYRYIGCVTPVIEGVCGKAAPHPIGTLKIDVPYRMPSEASDARSLIVRIDVTAMQAGQLEVTRQETSTLPVR